VIDGFRSWLETVPAHRMTTSTVLDQYRHPNGANPKDDPQP
jgi:hypothetical protein